MSQTDVMAERVEQDELEPPEQLHFPPTLSELKALWGIREKTGYGEPFDLFTWAQWLEMQAKLLHCMSRFQRAIERRETQTALVITLEMQEICTTLQKEVCAWIDVPLRKDDC